MVKRFQHIHFVGIGGIGMSGIAELLLNLGYKVSGSDLLESEMTGRLASLGAQVYKGHSADHIRDVDVVVYSSAVHSNNQEIAAAREQGIPTIRRAEMLAELMRLKYGIIVGGAHGKTTTTSMIASMLAYAGLDPTAVIGGRLDSLGGNAKLGQGEYLVAEADESDGSFIRLTPTVAVVTNLDREHMDHYRDISELQATFLEFMNKVPFYGLTILCIDSPHIPELLSRIEKRVMTYGFGPQADLQAQDISFSEQRSYFQVIHQKQPLGRLEILLPGQHNVLNALAAACVGLELDIPFKRIQEALAEFTGVQRRFQVKASVDGILVVDDYGHHPSEIRTTLRAAKQGWGKRVLLIYQPHRYTRTHYLWEDFLTAFHQADTLILMDIYPAGEEPIPGTSGSTLCGEIRKRGHRDVSYLPESTDVVHRVLNSLQPGDMVITMGAGDVWKVGEEIINRLENGDWAHVIEGK